MFLGIFLVASAHGEPGGKMDFSFRRMGVLVPPKTMPSKGKIVSIPASIKLEDGKLAIENNYYLLKLDSSPYLHFASVYSKCTETECLTEKSRLFFLWIDAKRLENKDFEVKDIKIEKDETWCFISTAAYGSSNFVVLFFVFCFLCLIFSLSKQKNSKY